MIHYVQGDATAPKTPGNKVIVHVCNDIGGWGRGFVLSLSKRWHEPERLYRRWFQEGANMLLVPGESELTIGQDPTLGAVQFVPVSYIGYPPKFKEVTYVANMIAQRGVLPDDKDTPPIRYDALESCLKHVKLFVEHLGDASVHMPRIGCGLSGGKWSDIEPIIERSLSSVDVYVYDFDTKDARTIPWNK
jgi:O-acetyl-ADP-ribose deacetylase (regulator of RNase III)